jgi:hypothetical protein
MRAPVLWALAACIALPPAAMAGTCAEEAELLARQYGLAGAGSAAPPEERSTKPTLESAPSPEQRRPAEGVGSSQPPPPLDADRRAKMEAALSAARASTDEQQCFKLLEEARSTSQGAAPAR